METHDAFQQALIKATRLGNKPDKKARNQLYALCKQATAGDISGDKPGFFDFEAKARYKAWDALRGMSKQDAMAEYVRVVNSLVSH